MASDEIINEIWEIAQDNSLDPIDKEEFGKDLRKTVFAELERNTEGVIYDINNEFARALPIILHQAKANPDLIYENNGKGFSVASGILTKAVLTVKYENRFIPGTVEYQKEIPQEHLSEVVLTAAVVDSMINNFDQLSYEERNLLNDNWLELSHVQRKDVMKCLIDEISARTDIDDNDKKTIKNSYEGVTTFEDFDAIFDSLPPEERAKAAEYFIQNVLKNFPNYEPIIENLREEGRDILDIVDYFRTNIRYLTAKANQTMSDLKFGNLTPEELKKAKMSSFAELQKYTLVYNQSMEESLIGMGLYEKIDYYGKAYNDISKTPQMQFFEENVSNELDSIQSRLGEVAVNLGVNYNEMFFTPGISFEDSREKLKRLLEIGKSKTFHFKKNESVEGEEKSEKSSIINPLVNMIKELPQDEVADLFGDELKDLLRKKAEELGISEEDKKTLEAMIASKDDDSFADLFYDDREGFLQELEKMSLLQHAKKQPVTDQEYGPTYRANAEEMVVDSKGLYKAQTDYKKYNEYDGTGTGEGSDASTTGTTVVQDNDTLEVDTITTHQPMPNSFINTARREDTDKEGKDLKDERDGGGLEDLPPENDLPDNAALNNSAKNANFISAARNMRATTDVMQEMGNITTIKVKEMDKKQDGPEVGDESDTIQPGEIE